MRLLLLVVGLGLGLFACGKPPCSASNCATGCCDAQGTCQAGTQPLACGIAGGSCATCLLGQQCLQGACFGGTGAGGGGGGGGSGGGTGGGTGSCSSSNCSGCCDSTGFCQTGTQNSTCGSSGNSCVNCSSQSLVCTFGICSVGSGGGAGGGSGGGAGGGTAGGPGLRLMPQTARVPEFSGLELSAEITGSAPNQLIDWSIESGGGQITPTGPSSAQFYAYSANATVRIRAQANFLSSLASFADLTIDPSGQPFLVLPQEFSSSAYVVAPGQPQTFAALRQVSSLALFNGLAGVDWFVWPAGSISDGNVVPSSGMQRIYAREQSSNIWASASISPQTTTLPSVAIQPSRATTTTNGVVQFTAILSSGTPQWQIASPNGGTISTSGTYTAPSTPGIYVVVVQLQGGSPSRAAAATIIVQ